MESIISAIIGGGGTGIILWILNRIAFKKDRKHEENNELDDIKKTLRHLERDTCRTQMLVLMSDYPSEHKELLTLAEKYFVELNGNFYMESIFKDWLRKNHLGTPSWYKKEK